MRWSRNETSRSTMSCVLAIGSNSDAATVLGTRYSAIDFRERIEGQLESCRSVELNFAGAFVTQSFVDELLGPLILRMGASALERLTFSGCSEEAKAIVRLVIAARIRDYTTRQHAS
jgi:STAS-like domain of unknown function (DUF4325)